MERRLLAPAQSMTRDTVVFVPLASATDVGGNDHGLTAVVVFFVVFVWQDPRLYHSNVHHASHHQDPQPATAAEVAAELQAIEAVARDSCALTVVLERVVVTPGGVLMACWQVGTPFPSSRQGRGSRLGA
jgi:hypothetical protein